VKLRRVARRLNFFHGVAGKYDLDCPASLPLGLRRYDRIAFPNEGRLTAYVDAGIASPTQAALVGYPKVDALVRGRGDAAEAARSLGLDASRPTAIFAPTFSTASVLHEAGETIIETLLDTGCNVIAKLHDRSLDPDPRFNGGVDWRRQLHRFSANPAFLLARGGDSTPYVRASDLMVSDHSSIAFEFCVLDRPVIVFEAPRLASAARINPEKIALLRSAALVVHDARSLRGAVTASLANPSAGSAARRQVAEQVFYRPGSATERAVSLVYELLELDASPVSSQVKSREGCLMDASVNGS
jgi:CDP-glycerol glycerophosphotransferase (TagB/SpsB family)